MADGLCRVNSIVLANKWVQTIDMFVPLLPRLLKRPHLLAALALLTACTPLTIYHRAGATMARMEKDLLACRVDALDKAPVTSQVRQGPPRYIPGYRHCNRAGHCYRRGGYYVPGEIYTVDVNARLRSQIETQCMAGKGYRRVTLPNCPAGTSSANAAASSIATGAVLPPLTENSCGLRGQGGEWQIITPTD